MHPRKRMRRRENPLDARFVTFSTYQRLPLFRNSQIKDAFAAALAGIISKYCLRLQAWVIMPEHVHLLVFPPHDVALAVLLRELKRPFAEQVIERWRELKAPILRRLLAPDGSTRFWQRGGGYDRNIVTEGELLEKINYIHANPVTRGLVESSEDWIWSSARWYAGDHSCVVRVTPILA